MSPLHQGDKYDVMPYGLEVRWTKCWIHSTPASAAGKLIHIYIYYVPYENVGHADSPDESVNISRKGVAMATDGKVMVVLS